MRIALVAFGTRGDVTPFAALGSRLQAAGHIVSLVTHAEFEPLARQHGLVFSPVPGSFQTLIGTSAGRRALGVPNNSPLGFRGVFEPFRECAEEVFVSTWQATDQAEGLVTSAVASRVVGLVASKRGVPLVLGLPIPSVPSRYLPHPGMPVWPLGRIYNRLTHVVATGLVRTGASDVFARWRREADRLSQAPFQPLRAVTLVAVSPIVLPRPLDWPDQTHLTGFWFLPTSTGSGVIDERLRTFVEQGPPPLVLGFGSMADNDPDALRTIVREALVRVRARAVVVTGSGGALSGLDCDDVCEVPFADYGWLFPRASAIVHQGGIGTASFALRTGTPQVTVAYCLDHTFWAWRLTELGVAPPGLRRHRLTSSALEKAIRRVLDDPGFRERAAALAPRVASDDGLSRATALLEDHFGIAGAARSA